MIELWIMKEVGWGWVTAFAKVEKAENLRKTKVEKKNNKVEVFCGKFV